MKIAVDAMGGDLAPMAPVHAVCETARAQTAVQFDLIGDEAKIRAQMPANVPDNVSIVAASEVIESDDEPVRAVRHKPNSSLVMAAARVHNHEADVMVSAGNTGALVAAGLLVIGRQKGVHRPALAPVLPTFRGSGMLLLDAGATMDASAENLYQYAQMGSAYSQFVLGVKSPRIGLLNVGTEAGKGNALTKQTYDVLEQSNLNFVGNLEARDLLNGDCDVVVCDGFVGNVTLKLIEGVGLGIFGALRASLTQSFKNRLAAAVLRPSLRAFRNRFDYAEYGGAPFLGVAGGCMKAHGSSNERAWQTALLQCIKFVHEDLAAKISQSVDNMSPNND